MSKKKLRILLLLVLNFIILFAVYRLMLRMEWAWGSVVYLLAAAVLTVAYYIINRGFGHPITDPAALPDEWNHKQKSAYIDMVTRRHETAKKLLYWLMPLAIVLMLDIIDVFLLDTLRRMFSA